MSFSWSIYCHIFSYNFALFTDFAVENGSHVEALPECRKGGTCLTDKTCVLDKLHSDMSYCIAGHEISVGDPTIYIK